LKTVNLQAIISELEESILIIYWPRDIMEIKVMKVSSEHLDCSSTGVEIVEL
jgi:hypothetical protein